MESFESIVLKMNQMLEAERFSRKEFEMLINILKKRNKTELKHLDFKYYSERRLSLFKKEKLSCIKNQDFEAAARFRIMEKECNSYITLRTEYNLQKSTFYHDQEYLFYFNLGTARNDKKAKVCFKKLM
ncbi:MAG: hypothetical protein IPJ37_19055 [Bacteroidales bacterium]|nr:hypothetical protein [Bacteroidales bacterium]